MTMPTMARDDGITRRAARVISQLIDSIMARMPTMVVTEVISWVRLWLSVWLTRSMSLVIRDKISPWVLVS